MQDELTGVVDHRVAGVVATLVARDDVRMLGEEVDDFTLSLVSPLGAYDDDGGHAAIPNELAGGRGRGDAARRRTACG